MADHPGDSERQRRRVMGDVDLVPIDMRVVLFADGVSLH